jgi:hypothetical protein
MCITKKEQWVYGGKSYDEELDAVKAALTDLGTRFVKEWHGNPLQGMLVLGADVTPLRDRYIALTEPRPTGGKGDPEKDTGEPMSTGNRRIEARDKFSQLESTHPIKRAALVFMEREGYAQPQAFWTRANVRQFDELIRILEIAR